MAIYTSQLQDGQPSSISYGILDPYCRSIIFDNNDIEAVAPIVDTLSNMSTLTILIITYNRSITAQGWIAISNILRSPNSVLESFTLDGNISDDVVISFANALVDDTQV